MPRCIACGNDTPNDQQFIEVLTLHMRGMGGDRRAQALGERVGAPICDACLDAFIARQADARGAVRRQALLFGGLMLAGLALSLLPPVGTLRLGLFGAALLLVGAAGLFKGTRDARARAAAVAGADRASNRARFLPQAVAAHLPRKAGENDLNYVPWEAGLRGRRTGELAAHHQLLPQIAQQLRERAEAAFSGAPGSDNT